MSWDSNSATGMQAPVSLVNQQMTMPEQKKIGLIQKEHQLKEDGQIYYSVPIQEEMSLMNSEL